MIYGFQSERDAADAAKLIRRERQYGDVTFEEPIRQSGGSHAVYHSYFCTNGYAPFATSQSYNSRSGTLTNLGGNLGSIAVEPNESIRGVANVCVYVSTPQTGMPATPNNINFLVMLVWEDDELSTSINAVVVGTVIYDMTFLPVNVMLPLVATNSTNYTRYLKALTLVNVSGVSGVTLSIISSSSVYSIQ